MRSPCPHSTVKSTTRQSASGSDATPAQNNQIRCSRRPRPRAHSTSPHEGTSPSSAAATATIPMGLSSPGLVPTRQDTKSPIATLTTPNSPNTRCSGERRMAGF